MENATEKFREDRPNFREDIKLFIGLPKLPFLELSPPVPYEFLPKLIEICMEMPRGWYSIYPWVERCGSVPHTLTLFKTKIADFPTLCKTEFRFVIPSLRHS